MHLIQQFVILIFQKGTKNCLNTVSHMGFEPTILRYRVHVGFATPGGDLLDDLLTPCAGILGSIAFTIYKTLDYLSHLVILYLIFADSW